MVATRKEKSHNLHIVGGEKTTDAIYLPNPPSLANFLYVLNDVIGIEADFVFSSWEQRRNNVSDKLDAIIQQIFVV